MDNRYAIVPKQTHMVRYQEPETVLGKVIQWIGNFFKVLFGWDDSPPPLPKPSPSPKQVLNDLFEQRQIEAKISVQEHQMRVSAAKSKLEMDQFFQEFMWWEKYSWASHDTRMRMIRERLTEEEALWELEYVRSQRQANAVPPAYQQPSRLSPPQPPKPSSPSLPPPAVEQKLSNVDIDKIAMEICVRLTRIDPSERDTTFHRVSEGIRQRFPQDSGEILKRVQQMRRESKAPY